MSKELVQRLRYTPLYEGHGEESELPEEAADRIEALAAQNLDDKRIQESLEESLHWSQGQCERLRAENERLRMVIGRALRSLDEGSQTDAVSILANSYPSDKGE